MTDPVGDKPRMFGGELDPVRLPWTWAVARLERARHYWIATTRADRRPHARPVWGVWLDDRLWFSTGSIAARNLLRSAEISVNLESGSEVVILEGTAHPCDDRDTTVRVVDVYNEKYRWDLDADALPGPFYEVRPRAAFGWTSDESGLDAGAGFHGTATRWTFAG